MGQRRIERVREQQREEEEAEVLKEEVEEGGGGIAAGLSNINIEAAGTEEE